MPSKSTPSKTISTSKPPTTRPVPASSSEDVSPQHIAPTTHPIPGPTTSIGSAYTNLHPVIVLAYFVQRFPSLVADPAAAMFRDLGMLAIAQAAYSVLCLPPTTAPVSGSREGGSSSGSGSSGDKSGRSKTGGRGKIRGKDVDVGMSARITTAVFALLLTFFAGVPVLFAGLVLLGGPLTTHHAETALCAAHLAFLAAPPLFYTRGVQPRAWRETAALLLPGDAVWGGSLGAVLGAWLGAVPIPLDWDRDWQRWPVTIVTGAYLGWAVGRVLGEFVFHGKRVPMDAE